MKITDINWKVFFLSLIGQFLISSLLYLGVRAPKQLDFLKISALQNEQPKTVSAQTMVPQVTPQPTPDPLDQIKSKLEDKKNDFNLTSPQSFHLVQPAYADGLYDSAGAYVLADFNSGQILASKNSTDQRSIASITKLMTATVALDLSNPEDLYIVTPDAANVPPTKIGVVPGETMPVGELLHAMLMTSANDAAQVIKDNIDVKYGEGTFVAAMNYKASVIGLQNTHFANPQGLDDPGNYSSASDVAILTHYAMTNYPLINQIVGTDYTYLPANGSHKQFDLYNWNGLLDVYPGAEGAKIGNTNQAGYTTSVVSERDGHKLIAVLLGAPGIVQRDLWTAQLLDFGFESYNIPPANVNQDMLQQKYATWKFWN